MGQGVSGKVVVDCQDIQWSYPESGGWWMSERGEEGKWGWMSGSRCWDFERFPNRNSNQQRLLYLKDGLCVSYGWAGKASHCGGEYFTLSHRIAGAFSTREFEIGWAVIDGFCSTVYLTLEGHIAPRKSRTSPASQSLGGTLWSRLSSKIK